MKGPDIATRVVSALVAWSCRHAVLVVAAVALLTVGAGAYVLTHFSVHTEIKALIPADVRWRQDAAAFERAFAEEGDDITVVIDGQTPELASDAAGRLAAALRPNTALFASVKRQAGGPFFDREGLLFLPTAEVRQTAEALIAAQPLLAPLASDPSLRGLTTALTTAAEAAASGQADAGRLTGPMNAIAQATSAVERGEPTFFSWRPLITGQAPDPSERRQFVEILPKLDDARDPQGQAAVAAVQSAAKVLGLDAAHGVRLRITGTTPIQLDELATLKEATGPLAALSLIAVLGVLYLAVRSARIIGAILATVLAGLAITAAGGLAVLHQFNLISVAFLPLFVGLGVDFAIQFCVRFRAELIVEPNLERALAAAGAGVGRGLTLAASATAIGFFALLPTRYRGISELGLVAGVGMIVALLLAVTFLPALLLLLQAKSPAVEAGVPALRAVDGVIARRSRGILRLSALLALGALALAPLLQFNFDPMRLRDPHTDSVATFFDLAKDPDTSPDTIDGLSPNLQAAQSLAAKLAASRYVRAVRTAASFVPADQPAKLAIIQDAATLLDPTLNPFDVAPPPTDAEQAAGLRAAAAALRGLAAAKPADAAAPARLAGLFEKAAEGPPALRARLQSALMAGLPVALDQVRAALTAEPVSLASLPQDIREDWITPDGRARLEALPAGNPRDSAALDRFTSAVRRIMPAAVGTPIAVKDTERLILGAFAQAGVLAALAITALLFIALRNARAVALTLAPVLLSGLLTVGLCGVLGLDINLENLIALPLLLAVGVSFNIYFVVAYGEGRQALLGSSLTRAILYSALATGVAFSALSLSGHPGTASMGRLLLISLGWTLVVTLIFQPALLRAAVRPPAAA